MKERLGRAALVLCVAFAAAAATSCKSGGTEKPAAEQKAAGVPKIVAVEATFDFGKAKQGDAIEHVFKIRNEGTAELKIEKARGS